MIHLLKANKGTSNPCLVDYRVSVLEERPYYIMALAIVLSVSAFPYHSHLKVKWPLPVLTVRVHRMVGGVVFGFSSYNQRAVICLFCKMSFYIIIIVNWPLLVNRDIMEV